MSLRPSLVTHFGNVMTSIGAPAHDLNRRPNGKAAEVDGTYEVYVFSLLVEVTQALNLNPTPKYTGAEFSVMRGPGDLKTSPQGHSYVEFLKNGIRYEIHVDTKVQTKAPKGALEIDVLVVHGDEATRCRTQKVRPVYNKARVLIEVKCLKDKFDTMLAKSFLGIWNQTGGKHGYSAVVSKTEAEDNAAYLLSHRNLDFHARVRPSPSGVASANALKNAITGIINKL